MLFYEILVGVAVSLSVGFLLLGRRVAGRPVQAEEQVGRYLASDPSLAEATLGDGLTQLSFIRRIILPAWQSLLARLGSLTPKRNVDYVTVRLETAGRPYGLNVLNFFGLKLLAAPMLAVLGFALNQAVLKRGPMIGVLCTLAFGLVGFYFPDLWLNSTVTKRQREIIRALPDALDMIVVCVEAGQSFDQALKRVSARWFNPLTEEFSRILAEVALGRTRREALSSASERIRLPDISNLMMAIIQADQLGVSIGKVLRTQAEQLRVLRRQRAEELAHQAAIKMLFPLVFLIFPSMLAVLLGPAVPLIMDTFQRIGGR